MESSKKVIPQTPNPQSPLPPSLSLPAGGIPSNDLYEKPKFRCLAYSAPGGGGRGVRGSNAR